MRKRLSYANVTATLALVFAMSGGAMAANSYLINSTKQINPKVLKKLTGKPGKNGIAGANGATGTAGATGATGPQGAKGETGTKGETGPKGETGEPGPLLTTLPSGKTETGVWSGGFTAATAGDSYQAGGSFPIPLAGALAAGKAIYVSGTSSTHCSGLGQADPGYLCVYQGYAENINAPISSNVFNAEEIGAADASAGARGFAILLSAHSAGLTRVSGSFAVTQP